MEWLLSNPERSMLECARTFQVTQAWLSCIVHSDIFQARYQKMLGEHFDTRVVPLRDKMVGLAHKTLDNLAVAVEASADPEMNLDIATKMLNGLGYGSKAPAGGVTVHGNVQVVSAATPEEIQAARARYRQAQVQLPAIEGQARLVNDD